MFGKYSVFVVVFVTLYIAVVNFRIECTLHSILKS